MDNINLPAYQIQDFDKKESKMKKINAGQPSKCIPYNDNKATKKESQNYEVLLDSINILKNKIKR